MPQTAIPSDEDHAIKRKNKSSSKRRRRRRSSGSSSSDDFRSLRKSSRREAKRSRRSSSQGGDHKKRKSSKKSSKKKSRKSRRYTSSDSSRSCSTCRGRSSSPGDSLPIRCRSRSRSPVRKSKLRVRGRSSGRDRSRRSRYRSLSCSTCSAGSRSRSPRKDESLGRKDVSRHTRTKLSADERIAITRRRQEKKGRSEEATYARKDPGEAYARKDPSEDEPYKKQRSVSSKANGGSRGLAEDSSAIKNAEVVANRMPAGDSDGNDHLGLESGSSRGRAASTNTGDSDGNDHLGLESGSSRGRAASTNTGVVAGTGISEAEDLEMILRQKALENFRKFRCGIPASSTSVGDAKAEAINSESQRSVELKLASSLDNHKYPPSGGHSIKVVDTLTSKSHNNNVTSKLAGELKINSFSNTQHIQHQVKNVRESSDKIVSEQMSLLKGSLKPTENKPASSLDNSRHTHGREQPVTVGINSLSVLVDSGLEDKSATKLAGDHNISSSNRSTDDLGMSTHKSTSQMSSEQSSLTKDIEGERAVTEPKSGSTLRPDGNIADMSASGTLCPNTESENCKSGEPVDATVSGGQFEQKTFSRTRDGEVVQVSYKVYIPKKSTTLARRRLQR